MRSRSNPAVPAALEEARQRFELFRSTRKGKSRIPEALWACAAELARKYGVGKTGQVLRLNREYLKRRTESAGNESVQALRVDHQALKRRMETAATHGSSGEEAAGAFLELVAPGSACSPECIVELENRRGAKMRIHLKGAEAPDLTALTKSFWSAET